MACCITTYTIIYAWHAALCVDAVDEINGCYTQVFTTYHWMFVCMQYCAIHWLPGTILKFQNVNKTKLYTNEIVPMVKPYIFCYSINAHYIWGLFTCWPVSGQISKQSSNLYIACCTVCKCSGRNLLFTRGRTSASGYSIVVWCMSVYNMWVCLPVYNYIIWMPSGGLGFLKEGFQ